MYVNRSIEAATVVGGKVEKDEIVRINIVAQGGRILDPKGDAADILKVLRRLPNATFVALDALFADER